jgi:hypothetical protein
MNTTIGTDLRVFAPLSAKCSTKLSVPKLLISSNRVLIIIFDAALLYHLLIEVVHSLFLDVAEE